VNHRAAEGQQFAGSPGGGYLLDQFRQGYGSLASTATPIVLPVGQVPLFDTQDFGSSFLSDVEPIAYTPNVKVGRISLSLGTSLASTASNATYAVKRFRAGVSATMATFNTTTENFAAAWAPVHRTGAQISNGTLIAGDQIVVAITSNTSGPPPLPAFQVVVDGEG
jgi:hypothetical protein